MSLLNMKCILFVALIGIAGWNFPWGLVVDASVLVTWAMVKRKRVPASARGSPIAAVAPNPSNDAFNAIAMAMLSDKVGTATDAAASELGVSPSKARQPARVNKAFSRDAEMAYKMKLLA